jgi:hypothetical protein
MQFFLSLSISPKASVSVDSTVERVGGAVLPLREAPHVRKEKRKPSLLVYLEPSVKNQQRRIMRGRKMLRFLLSQ